MVERAAIVAGILVLSFMAGYIVRERARRRFDALAGTALPAQIGSRLNSSNPGIVYFYGPHCSTCRRQFGVLEGLADSDGIPILRIDASRETHLADDFGVMTVPATVVVDRSKRVRSVNLGFRSADALREQLLSVSAK
jgi:thioredoxin-like negative regulator of GroEL